MSQWRKLNSFMSPQNQDLSRNFLPHQKFALALLLLLPSIICVAHAELKVPAIISDHMVLQQKLQNPIWGWDTPGTKVTVTFAGQHKSAQAGPDGKWMVKLDALPANEKPQTLTISGSDKKEIRDVLV